jgi:hypothetical protein
MAYELCRLKKAWYEKRSSPPATCFKSAKGSGIKPVMSSENLKGSEEMRKKDTKGEDRTADNLKQKHPNRNTNKGNSTNAGGDRH